MLNRMQDNENNKKFLQMFHGPGDGFFKKSPLPAGGKVITRSKYTSGFQD